MLTLLENEFYFLPYRHQQKMNEIKQKLKAADLVSLKLFCICTKSI